MEKSLVKLFIKLLCFGLQSLGRSRHPVEIIDLSGTDLPVHRFPVLPYLLDIDRTELQEIAHIFLLDLVRLLQLIRQAVEFFTLCPHLLVHPVQVLILPDQLFAGHCQLPPLPPYVKSEQEDSNEQHTDHQEAGP